MNPDEDPNLIILAAFWSRALEAVKRAAEAAPARALEAGCPLPECDVDTENFRLG